MLSSLFRWFYCLDIPEAILIMLLATACFLFLRRRFRLRSWWKPLELFCGIAWIGLVVTMTLLNRTSGNAQEASLMPFHSYLAVLGGGSREILRSNFMNLMLFYPAGLLWVSVWPKGWKLYWRILLTVALLTAVSAAVEYSQYCFNLGKLEMDDVIHNLLGAFLGAAAGALPPCARNKMARQAPE